MWNPNQFLSIISHIKSLQIVIFSKPPNITATNISGFTVISPRDIQSLIHSSQSVSCHDILLSWYLAGDIQVPYLYSSWYLVETTYTHHKGSCHDILLSWYPGDIQVPETYKVSYTHHKVYLATISYNPDIWLETYKSQRHAKSHTLITKCILPRYPIILISGWRHTSPRDMQSLIHSSQSVSCHDILLSWYLAGDIPSLIPYICTYI